MKGVLLVSHGRLAQGMADSARLFYGDEIAQFGYLCLDIGDSPDDFGSLIEAKAKELDTGDGVIVLADLYGGTPCNQTIPLLKEGLDLIPGMNLGMVMQLLSDREYETVQVDSLIDAGRRGIVNIKELLDAETENGWF